MKTDSSERGILAAYQKIINHYPVLSKEEEREHGVRSFTQNDLRAREKLIVHNLRFVVSVAYTYKDRGVSMMDLIQEGNCALIESAATFNPYLENRLISFARLRIRGAMIQMIAGRRTLVQKPDQVRLSKDRIVTTKSLLDAHWKLKEELGREPTTEEIARKTEYKGDKDGMFLILKPIVMLSLESPVTEQGRNRLSLGESLADENALSGPLVAEAREILEEKEARLHELMEAVRAAGQSPRNQLIFSQYYGLEGHERMILEDIGEAHGGLSKQRINEIICRIWEKLEEARSPFKKSDLEQELENIDRLRSALCIA